MQVYATIQTPQLDPCSLNLQQVLATATCLHNHLLSRSPHEYSPDYFVYHHFIYAIFETGIYDTARAWPILVYTLMSRNATWFSQVRFYFQLELELHTHRNSSNNWRCIIILRCNNCLNTGFHTCIMRPWYYVEYCQTCFPVSRLIYLTFVYQFGKHDSYLLFRRKVTEKAPIFQFLDLQQNVSLTGESVVMLNLKRTIFNYWAFYVLTFCFSSFC